MSKRRQNWAFWHGTGLDTRTLFVVLVEFLCLGRHDRAGGVGWRGCWTPACGVVSPSPRIVCGRLRWCAVPTVAVITSAAGGCPGRPGPGAACLALAWLAHRSGVAALRRPGRCRGVRRRPRKRRRHRGDGVTGRAGELRGLVLVTGVGGAGAWIASRRCGFGGRGLNGPGRVGRDLGRIPAQATEE
jgi:hypothetical protein